MSCSTPYDDDAMQALIAHARLGGTIGIRVVRLRRRKGAARELRTDPCNVRVGLAVRQGLWVCEPDINFMTFFRSQYFDKHTMAARTITPEHLAECLQMYLNAAMVGELWMRAQSG